MSGLRSLEHCYLHGYSTLQINIKIKKERKMINKIKGGCCGDDGCCGGKEEKKRDRSCDCRDYLKGFPNPHPWILIGFK